MCSCDVHKLFALLQTYLASNPLKAASGNGLVSIWGTSPDAIDESEDRDRWMACLTKLGIRQPAGGSARCAVGRTGALHPPFQMYES
jgi:carbamoyl-phosphate synthase large subunit